MPQSVLTASRGRICHLCQVTLKDWYVPYLYFLEQKFKLSNGTQFFQSCANWSAHKKLGVLEVQAILIHAPKTIHLAFANMPLYEMLRPPVCSCSIPGECETSEDNVLEVGNVRMTKTTTSCRLDCVIKSRLTCCFRSCPPSPRKKTVHRPVERTIFAPTIHF